MKTRRAAVRPLNLAIIALLFCIGVAAAPVQAGVAVERHAWQAGYLRVQQGEISRDQAAARVKRRFGGKILAISETQRNGRSVYRIKGLSDKSQVYVVYVDKRSGRISR